MCRTRIPGGEHLWFVPIILFCYLITPILEAYRDRFIINSRSLWLGTIIAIISVSIFWGVFASFFNPAWLSCYVIGYALGINERRKQVKNSLIVYMLGTLASIGNGIQIYCDYIKPIEFFGLIDTVYQYFRNYNHVFLGAFLFLLLKNIFDRLGIINNTRMTRLLDTTDRYSYEVYLVRQFLILGPFSLMVVTPILPVNIAIILFGIVFLAWTLKKVEKRMAGWL